MSYQVLARKYRPMKFSDVIGQEHVTRPLVESIKSDRMAHAYIFSGPRGIGKTTTARLLAMSVNCQNRSEGDSVEPCNECDSCEQIRGSRDVDVVEIDGASNNSVDQVRELRENARYAPTRNRFKIYIIDEVHMLSRSAFNALLKILEEPPEHVLFVFATTEIDQLPDTILSRCQRFDFRLIPAQDIVEALQDICSNEEVDAQPEALYLIAKFAEGSLRDAQSILDQMINMASANDGVLTEELISDTWGVASYDRLISLLNEISLKNSERIIQKLAYHLEQGNDLMSLISDLAEMLRNCLLLKETRDKKLLQESIPGELIPELEEIGEDLTRSELSWMFEEFLDLHKKLKQNTRFQRELAEVGLVRISEGRPKYNLSEIVDRLEQIEENPKQVSNQNNDKPKCNENEISSNETVERKSHQNDSGDTNTRTSEEEKNTPRISPKDNGSNTSADENRDYGEQWGQVLEAISGPAKAYLLSSEGVNIKGEEVLVRFREKYRNHVQRLRQDKFRQKINNAIEEVLGDSYELNITIIGELQNPSDEKNSEEENHNDEAQKFIEETKDVFNAESAETID